MRGDDCGMAHPLRRGSSIFPRARGMMTPAPLLLLAAFTCDGPDTAPPADAGAAPAAAAAPGAPAAPPAAPVVVGGPAPGKYGCSESIPRFVNGSYEYEAQGRGFVNIRADGTYTDPFGVAGTYRHDEAAAETHFTGAAWDGAVVTPLEDRPKRLWVVIPAGERERRWTCSLT